MKRLAIVGALAALAVSAVPLAHAASTSSTAEKTCRAQRSTAPGMMGPALFKATFGTNADKSNAFGKCVSKTLATMHQNAQNAASQCRASQQSDRAAFAQKWGAGHNALGKCISATTQAANQHSSQNTVSAAKSCRAARQSDRAAFAQKWGTSRNAFGKCVSKTAEAKQQS
jgi:hypothetical protein